MLVWPDLITIVIVKFKYKNKKASENNTRDDEIMKLSQQGQMPIVRHKDYCIICLCYFLPLCSTAITIYLKVQKLCVGSDRAVLVKQTYDYQLK